MSLLTATLLPGLFLIALGALFLVSNSAIVSMFKAMPRSRAAAIIFFGGGALWFVLRLRGLSEADLIMFQSPTPFMIGFGVLSVASFFFIPDFLAVRGLSVLTLLAAWPLLMAAFMEEPWQRKLMVAFAYLCVAAAIYLGAVPFRLRDFFQWLFTNLGRARAFGGLLLGYGILLTAVAFTY